MNPKWLSRVVMLLLVHLSVATVCAQDPNTSEIIKQLQKRIEELEKKVQTLEGGKPAEPQAVDPQSKQRIEELDQKVKILERNRDLEIEAAEAKAKEAPQIKIGSEGFSFASADKNFAIGLKGILQVDSRTFFNDSGIAGNDSILLRRARPILEGTVYRDFDFLFVPDFAGSSPQIFDAYVNYRYNPALQLRAGKFKSPIGLEQLVADRDTFFNERSLATALVPNRDLGFDLHGDPFEGVVSYDLGLFNGVGDGRNSSNFDFDDNKAFEGRLFLQPFKTTSNRALQGIGVGVAGSYENIQGPSVTGLPATTGGTLPGYATDGQQQFFAYNPGTNAVVTADGEHWRLSPQAYYYLGPFGFMAEYVISNQKVTRTVTAPFASANLDNRAWEITGSWVLTGEDASYKGVTPLRPFKPLQGDWGALQLVARYSELDVDDDAFPLFSNPASSASEARAFSVGLNWFLNRNILIKTSFSHTDFSGGGGAGTTPPAAVTRRDENVFFTRIQLAF
jgi:phosphate-selective porin OprO and OprP